MKIHQTQSLRALTGYLTAVPTPFRNCGESIDENAFSAFCTWQVEGGVSGLVVCGTTGEAPTLRAEEQRRLVRLAAKAANGRVPVIAGAGSNATAHAVELARAAEAAGADAILAVVPYYNKPSQEGLYRHFRSIAESIGIPLILYDVPSRTGCGLAVETVARLAELPQVVGLKDATGDLARPVRLRRLLGNEFRLFTGEDATALGYLAQGGDGCISVVSNVAPKLCVRVHAAFHTRDELEARTIWLTVARLTAALFAESNPVPVKYALKLLGHMSAAVRLPLCEASEGTRREVAEALTCLGLTTRAGDADAQPRPVRLGQAA
jgi:4-hydroxy-tetrahydrodipicolinate synthase